MFCNILFLWLIYILFLSLLLLNPYAPRLIRKVILGTDLSQFLQYLLFTWERWHATRSVPQTLSWSTWFTSPTAAVCSRTSPVYRRVGPLQYGSHRSLTTYNQFDSVQSYLDFSYFSWAVHWLLMDEQKASLFVTSRHKLCTLFLWCSALAK
jgi:hypothetical protein